MTMLPSSALFRTIFDSTFQFIGLLKPDGTLIAANQTALDFGGLTAEDVVGKPFWECHWWTISSETQAELRTAIQQAVQGTFIRYEVDVRGAGEHVATIDFSLTPVFDKAGNIIHLIPEGRDITNQKQTETLLAGVLMSSLDGIAVFRAVRDSDGKIVDFGWLFANPQVEVLLQRPIDTLIGQRLLDVLPGNRDLGLFDSYVQVVETGVPASHEFFYDHDNIQGWFQNTAVKLDDGFTVTFRDITQQKAAEEMRLALSAAQMGTWEIHLETQEITRSQSTDRLFGYIPDGTRRVIDDYMRQVHPDDVTRVAQAITYSITQQAEHTVEYRIIQPDNRVRWVVSRGNVVLDAAGQPVRLVGALTDITKRKQTEEALHESEARYRHLANAIPQIVWTSAADGTQEYLNQRWTEYTGISFEESRGGNTQQAIHPDDQERAQTAWNVSQQNDTPYEAELRLRRFDGLYRWHLARSIPIRDATGTVIRWFGTSTDIHAQKEAEAAQREAKEAAETAQQMQSAFLANMSHEIRTPLTSMIGFATLLTQSLAGKERTLAQRIEEGGKRLLETLNAVLMLARLEANRVEITLEALSVATEVQEIIPLYQRQAEAKGLVLALDVLPAAHTAHVRLDRGALTSIIQNLIANALKFTEQGSIMVIVDADTADPPWVHISVEDTGVGIAPPSLPHLFDTFRQGDVDATRTQSGIGVGLAIAKQLTEKLGGTISVTSTLGYGSRFTVSFPCTEADSTQLVTQWEETVPMEHIRKHVLLVEDNADTQMLMEELLEHAWALTVAANGQEALAVAQERLDTTGQPFDAILMDIHLGGGLNGIDVLTALRALREYQTVPIAALTAYALPEDRERFLKMGFDAYLSKPFTADELFDLLAHLLPM